MHFENPFFTRELRALSRRKFMPFAAFLALSVVLLFFPVWLTDVKPGSEWDNLQTRVPFALFLLITAHSLLCYAAGWNLGVRVFAEEQRQNTLETLRLVSMHPAWWLALKLAFPVYGLALVWIAPLPLYLGLAMRGYPLIYPSTLEPAALLALCAGITGLAAGLLAPPDGTRLRLLLGKRITMSDLATNLSRSGLAPWIGVVLFVLCTDWFRSYFQHTPTFFSKPFFTTQLSTAHGLALLLGAYVLGALLTAWAHADVASNWAARFAGYGRTMAVLTAYVLFLGYTWAGSQDWARVLMLGVPLFFIVSVWMAERRKRRRPEDSGAAREIAWLRRRTDNPVFIRDLLVTLRAAGLVRQALTVWMQLILATLLVLGIFASFAMMVRGSMSGAADPNALLKVLAGTWSVLAYMMLVPALLGIGARAGRQWAMERKQDTLTQLLQTPLDPESIVRGRWAAALLLGAVRASPLVLMFVLGSTIANWWQGADAWLFLAVWFFGTGMMCGAGAAGPGAHGRRGVDPLSAGALSIYAVLGEGALFFFLLRFLDAWNGASEYFKGYVLVTALVNVALAWVIHRRAIADVERLRRLDVG